MKIELTRFRVLPGKTSKVDRWMEFLNGNLPAVLETLEGEKMFVETIFSETLGSEQYLYWYSIQGEGGIDVQDSQHEVDKVHLQFWKECIDPEFAPQELAPRVSMIAARIQKHMRQESASNSPEGPVTA